ncbi:MAG: hypothetical protein ACYDCC_12170 [Actinomycetota bacterium]
MNKLVTAFAVIICFAVASQFLAWLMWRALPWLIITGGLVVVFATIFGKLRSPRRSNWR